jgi:hypothetical protein
MPSTKMNEKFGGVQSHNHSSAMTEGCLGPYPAVRNVGGVLFAVKLKVGEVQDIQFKDTDLPPFYRHAQGGHGDRGARAAQSREGEEVEQGGASDGRRRRPCSGGCRYGARRAAGLRGQGQGLP